MSADFQHELLGSPSPHPASNPSQDLGPLTFIDPNWIHDFSSNHLVALPPTAFGDALEVEPRIDTLTPLYPGLVLNDDPMSMFGYIVNSEGQVWIFMASSTPTKHIHLGYICHLNELWPLYLNRYANPSVILSIRMLGFLLDLRNHERLFSLYVHPDDDTSVPLTVVQPHGFYDDLDSHVYKYDPNDTRVHINIITASREPPLTAATPLKRTRSDSSIDPTPTPTPTPAPSTSRATPRTNARKGKKSKICPPTIDQTSEEAASIDMATNSSRYSLKWLQRYAPQLSQCIAPARDQIRTMGLLGMVNPYGPTHADRKDCATKALDRAIEAGNIVIEQTVKIAGIYYGVKLDKAYALLSRDLVDRLNSLKRKADEIVQQPIPSGFGLASPNAQALARLLLADAHPQGIYSFADDTTNGALQVQYGHPTIEAMHRAIFDELPEGSRTPGEAATHGSIALAGSLIHDAVLKIAEPHSSPTLGFHFSHLLNKSEGLDDERYREWRVTLQNRSIGKDRSAGTYVQWVHQN